MNGTDYTQKYKTKTKWVVNKYLYSGDFLRLHKAILNKYFQIIH